jgi:hypothetical protein
MKFFWYPELCGKPLDAGEEARFRFGRPIFVYIEPG